MCIVGILQGGVSADSILRALVKADYKGSIILDHTPSFVQVGAYLMH
jgi:hypothetical protein